MPRQRQQLPIPTGGIFPAHRRHGVGADENPFPAACGEPGFDGILAKFRPTGFRLQQIILLQNSNIFQRQPAVKRQPEVITAGLDQVMRMSCQEWFKSLLPNAVHLHEKDDIRIGLLQPVQHRSVILIAGEDVEADHPDLKPRLETSGLARPCGKGQQPAIQEQRQHRNPHHPMPFPPPRPGQRDQGHYGALPAEMATQIQDPMPVTQQPQPRASQSHKETGIHEA